MLNKLSSMLNKTDTARDDQMQAYTLALSVLLRIVNYASSNPFVWAQLARKLREISNILDDVGISADQVPTIDHFAVCRVPHTFLDALFQANAFSFEPFRAELLLTAIELRHDEHVRVLLEHGADPNLRDAHGKSAFQLAVEKLDLGRAISRPNEKIALMLLRSPKFDRSNIDECCRLASEMPVVFQELNLLREQ